VHTVHCVLCVCALRSRFRVGYYATLLREYEYEYTDYIIELCLFDTFYLFKLYLYMYK